MQSALFSFSHWRCLFCTSFLGHMIHDEKNVNSFLSCGKNMKLKSRKIDLAWNQLLHIFLAISFLLRYKNFRTTFMQPEEKNASAKIETRKAHIKMLKIFSIYDLNSRRFFFTVVSCVFFFVSFSATSFYHPLGDTISINNWYLIENWSWYSKINAISRESKRWNWVPNDRSLDISLSVSHCMSLFVFKP